MNKGVVKTPDVIYEYYNGKLVHLKMNNGYEEIYNYDKQGKLISIKYIIKTKRGN